MCRVAPPISPFPSPSPLHPTPHTCSSLHSPSSSLSLAATERGRQRASRHPARRPSLGFVARRSAAICHHLMTILARFGVWAGGTTGGLIWQRPIRVFSDSGLPGWDNMDTNRNLLVAITYSQFDPSKSSLF